MDDAMFARGIRDMWWHTVFTEREHNIDITAVIHTVIKLVKQHPSVASVDMLSSCCVTYQDTTELARLLIDAGVSPDGGDDLVPLSTALDSDNVRMIKFLIGQNASVNKKWGKHHRPLVFMVRSCEALRALLDAGVDLSAVDDEGRTVMAWARVDEWSKDVVQMLVDAGAPE